MTSTAADGQPYQMVMRKGDPSYSVAPRRTLFGEGGTEVRIAPLLEGVRALSGEKIQWYLAAELRDRIRETGVRINVVDRLSRKQYAVEPRQYEGRLLHQLPALRTPGGDIYVELYLTPVAEANSDPPAASAREPPSTWPPSTRTTAASGRSAVARATKPATARSASSDSGPVTSSACPNGLVSSTGQACH